MSKKYFILPTDGTYRLTEDFKNPCRAGSRAFNLWNALEKNTDIFTFRQETKKFTKRGEIDPYPMRLAKHKGWLVFEPSSDPNAPEEKPKENEEKPKAKRGRPLKNPIMPAEEIVEIEEKKEPVIIRMKKKEKKKKKDSLPKRPVGRPKKKVTAVETPH